MSGPNLSEYFRNDAPSMFDEIVQNTTSAVTVATSTAFPSTDSSMTNLETNLQKDFQALSVQAQTEDDVEDSIRDMWKTIQTDSNIPPLLTMPGLQSSTELSDPIKAAVTYLLGETEANERQSLTINDVSEDVAGVKQLIAAGSFRAAANLTFRCLTTYGQGFGRAGQPTRHTPHSLQLWFTRLSLLIKLGEYDLCKREAEAFGLLERPDMYYDFYPEAYNNRKGSMATFSFRLLIAKLPSYLGLHKVALDRLTDMLLVSKEIREHFAAESNEKAEQFWTKREQTILQALINCALTIKDFSLADFLMERLTTMKEIDPDTMRSLYSSWGRIYLQCGDVFGAERKFSEARRIRVTNTAESDSRDFIDRGLIAVAQNDFKEAYSFFQKSLAIDSTNALVLNNMAVCLLYLGKQKDAIGIFERAITANEQKDLSESLILNLCTLYELESSNDVSKKLALLKKINRQKSELNINIEYCLKLPTGNK
ncbi:trafficking protein particle complex subunit 12 [Sitodiplosis mosellana]|uniref:trafficking protein particle complex subunit 12 n=1 Tax=Sitodiplosis mosellana TaxID=263140 RepID=UPI0024450663|nr:trafficking protein particle complex subunit 12 [Sitodiplosis mosellana]